MNRHFKLIGAAIFALSCLLSFVADADPLERSSRWRNSEKTGKLVIPAVFDSAGHFADDDDRAAVVKDGKFGWINKEGQLVIPAQFDGGGHFTDGLAPAKVGGQHGSYGYIDRTGKFVIPPLLISTEN